MNKVLVIVIVIVALGAGAVLLLLPTSREGDIVPPQISSFEECIAAGNPAMESYPRQCRTAEGQMFVENIGNELEKLNLIRIDAPRPNQVISSPLEISGQARGFWFFEGDFPVVLTDLDGLIIAEGFVTAEGEWMTEDFVLFSGTLEFTKPTLGSRGSLILQKDNPSGSPEHDDALEIPVTFESVSVCGLVPETGPCEAAIVKYFFDKEKGCTSFLWGGCEGVVPFHELSECVDSCETESGVIGQVLYGPFCPVERLGDPTCDDRPYPTMVDVYHAQDLEKLITTVSTDNNARFLVHVEPGTYVLQPQGSTPFPRCEEKTVEVGQDRFGTTTLLCDTGIR